MEDDEEYSYKGYSKKTAEELKKNEAIATFVDDEEYSYSGYTEATAAEMHDFSDGATVIGDEEEYSFGRSSNAQARHGEQAITSANGNGAYGDYLAEEFSAESAIKKVTKLTKMSEVTVNYVLSAIYLIVGVLCVSLTSYIEGAFSYIVGAFMAVIGLGQFIYAIKTKEYVHTNSNKTAMSLILMALAVLILVEKSSADTIIAIAWGFLGLLEGAHAFNHAFSRIARSERCSYYLVKGIIEAVLAFLLLYDPVNHLELHIFVFGINLLFDAVTMFPPFKNYFSRK
jgi:uncharacterized membrane protein HdeD (DUF308 family)